MSGGKDKKVRINKAQGWEEAGAEFYQESYPVDWENFQRDPTAIATLLPSKQNRAAATMRRVRQSQQENKNTKRRQPATIRRKSLTTRRGSQYQDVQVSMLPDLSQDLTDEERIWEEIHEIKAMPVPMSQKKEMKSQLQNTTKLRLQGLDQIKWQRRKLWQQFLSKWLEIRTKTELWRNSLKKIEGNFGTGILAYFLFLKWLMLLNFVIFVFIFIFIVIPHITLTKPEEIRCDNALLNNTTECCSDNLFDNNSSNSFNILDILQGTGFMEKTLIFYGTYTNKIFGYYPEKKLNSSQNFATLELYYDFPLAYVSTTLVYFIISLIAIVKAASHEFKDRIVDGEGQFYLFCNLIFGGWDFCIQNEKSADIKHKALFNEMKGLIHSHRMEYERNNRSHDVMIKLIAKRILINILVVIILLISAMLIFVLFNISLKYFETDFDNNTAHISYSSQMLEINLNDNFKNNSDFINDGKKYTILFYEFLPYIGIVFLNLIVPLIFNYLVQFEEYSPTFIVKVILLRTVFLRLSSLIILLSRLYFFIVPASKSDCNEQMLGKLQCWETFVGQQFYKLVITDFVIHIFVTFFINFPRALLANHVKSKFARFICEQEFELSKHVLDVVYSQTLYWLGSFYVPFLPALATVLMFFMFYIKKFACLVNSTPSSILYRAARSKSLFMFTLLFSYVIAVVPVVYSIAEITPSKYCGPFKGFKSVWDAAISAFLKMPNLIQEIIFFFGTAGFAIPSFIILMLLIYYYYAVSDANRTMVEVLKNQLVLEGHDKQFLLNRLSSFLKQQQDYQKKLRQYNRDCEQRTNRDRNKIENES